MNNKNYFTHSKMKVIKNISCIVWSLKTIWETRYHFILSYNKSYVGIILFTRCQVILDSNLITFTAKYAPLYRRWNIAQCNLTRRSLYKADYLDRRFEIRIFETRERVLPWKRKKKSLALHPVKENCLLSESKIFSPARRL